MCNGGEDDDVMMGEWGMIDAYDDNEWMKFCMWITFLYLNKGKMQENKRKGGILLLV